MKRKALVISSFPAPYRISVFKQLSTQYDMDVFFDDDKDGGRSSEWFYKNKDFHYLVVNSKEGKRAFKKALKTIKQYDFVLAYDATTRPAIKAIFLCRLLKIPYFVNCDGAFIQRHIVKDAIKRFIFNGATGCFSSGQSGNQYFETYGVKHERIFNHKFTSLEESDILSTPPTEKTKAEKRLELGLNNIPTVISVGQFIQRKGFDVLLKAWKELNDDAQLIIIGGGEERDKYISFIKEANLTNVLIYDFMKKDELYRYYDASDIFVLPTREDIWGLVVNEAMARGLPVITTNRCIAGLELIEDGINGFIVPVDDHISLARRITQLIINKDLIKRMSEKNIELSQNMTLNQIAQDHIAVIDSLIK